MEPLINPWIFYLINLAESIQMLLGILLCLMVIACLFYLMYVSNEYNLPLDKEDPEELAVLKNIKKLFVSFVVVLLIMTAIPSQATIYKMLIASQITENNYNFTKNELTELIDYIAGKFKGE